MAAVLLILGIACLLVGVAAAILGDDEPQATWRTFPAGERQPYPPTTDQLPPCDGVIIEFPGRDSGENADRQWRP